MLLQWVPYRWEIFVKNLMTCFWRLSCRQNKHLRAHKQWDKETYLASNHLLLMLLGNKITVCGENSQGLLFQWYIGVHAGIATVSAYVWSPYLILIIRTILRWWVKTLANIMAIAVRTSSLTQNVDGYNGYLSANSNVQRTLQQKKY